MSSTVKHITRFIYGVWDRISEGHFGLVAAGVAFFAMFSVFPGLAAAIAIWGMLADPVVISGYLEVLNQFLPQAAAQLIETQVLGLVNAPRATLGGATAISLLIALYSARNGVSALVVGLDVVNRAQARGWLYGIARDMVLTLALIGALMGAMATVVIVPIVLSYIPIDEYVPLVTRVLPWIGMFFLVLTCLSIVYRYGPNIPKGKRPPWFSFGVIFAAVAWAAVSLGFSIYLENFNSYNRIYGSIGAAIILMMWLYLSVWAVLVGGAINAELQQRRIIRRQMGRL